MQAIDAEGNWEGKWAAVTGTAEAEAVLGSAAVVEAELGRLESQRAFLADAAATAATTAAAFAADTAAAYTGAATGAATASVAAMGSAEEETETAAQADTEAAGTEAADTQTAETETADTEKAETEFERLEEHILAALGMGVRGEVRGAAGAPLALAGAAAVVCAAAVGPGGCCPSRRPLPFKSPIP